MIRRELLDGCRFKEGIYFEDTEWTPRLLLKASRVTSTDLMVYNYLMREGSITQSVDEKKKRKVLDDKLRLIDSMNEQKMAVDDKRWFEGMVAQTVLSVLGYISENYYVESVAVCKNLKLKKIFPLSRYHSTQAAARKIRIANVSPKLLCWLLNKR